MDRLCGQLYRRGYHCDQRAKYVVQPEPSVRYNATLSCAQHLAKAVREGLALTGEDDGQVTVWEHHRG